jgi:hypothetical protein
MKRLGFTRVAGMAAVFALAIPAFGCGGGDTTVTTAANASDVTVDIFTDALAGYGAWVDVAPYGKVWQPSADLVGDNFIPYATDGHWAINDDGDWVFASKHDDEFGWAVYHYGRWAYSDDFGYVWVPGVEWAPAWVQWAYGAGYTAWAALPPDGVTWTPNQWIVVEEGHFIDDNVVTVRLAPERYTGIWATITPITEVSARGHFSAGPAASHWKAVVKVSVGRPAAGSIAVRAKALATKNAGHAVVAKPHAAAAVKASASVSVAAGANAAAGGAAGGKVEAKAEAKGATTAAAGATGKKPPPAPAPPPAKKAAPPPKKK